LLLCRNLLVSCVLDDITGGWLHHQRKKEACRLGDDRPRISNAW